MQARLPSVEFPIPVFDDDAVTITQTAKHIFRALRTERDDAVSSQFVIQFLERSGIVRGDPRLYNFFASLKALDALDKNRDLTLEEFAQCIHHCASLMRRIVTGELRVADFERFSDIVKTCYEKILLDDSGNQAQYIRTLSEVNPDQFGIAVTTVHGQHCAFGDCDVQFSIQSCSKPVSYLIALEQFGEEYVHKCVGAEPSGRKFNEMTLKSRPTKEDPEHAVPHNPMINAGAMMTASMVYPEWNRYERFNRVIQYWQRLTAGTPSAVVVSNRHPSAVLSPSSSSSPAGKKEQTSPRGSHPTTPIRQQGPPSPSSCPNSPPSARNDIPQVSNNPSSFIEPSFADELQGLSIKDALAQLPTPIGYDDETYRAESDSADRNWCLAYMMKQCNAFPPCSTGLSDTLELYFQMCSLLSTTRAMSVLAATLANGGLNPYSGERVASPEHVRRVLPLMLTSGMYDYSGQWAYDVGVPAKSGVGGCVYMVVPNVCGIAMWSPRLDENGNSVRAREFAIELVRHVSIHNFEVFSGLSRKKLDLTMRKNVARASEVGDILIAASAGDLASIITAYHAGTDLFRGDYDRRTALHLAASEGHTKIVKFLIEAAQHKRAPLSASDRWGGTPLDDAERHEHDEVVQVLREAGAERGRKNIPIKAPDVSALDSSSATLGSVADTTRAPRILFAAFDGDLDELVRLNAQGANLSLGDYDRRTPLHLAATEGHVDCVRYLLLTYGRERLEAKDRFGRTPLDDAESFGHAACLELMRRSSSSDEKKKMTN